MPHLYCIVFSVVGLGVRFQDTFVNVKLNQLNININVSVKSNYNIFMKILSHGFSNKVIPLKYNFFYYYLPTIIY